MEDGGSTGAGRWSPKNAISLFEAIHGSNGWSTQGKRLIPEVGFFPR